MNRKEQKKSMCMKSVMAFALAVVLFVSICPITANAAEKLKWTALGKGVFQLEGTEVKVEVSPGLVHVTGSGAIPDYDYWDLKSRPWSTCEAEAVTIDDTITSIGAYVFHDLPKLKYITISTKTFIKDYTTFYKSAQTPIFRIKSSGVTTEMIGTIPYTSLDSIKALAQSGYMGASYVFDNNTLASEFQGSTNPTIKNVFSAADSNAPWNDLIKYSNGGIYTSICHLSPNTPNVAYTVRGTKRYQGKECYQAFATAIGDYTFGNTFDITVTSNDAAKARVGKTNAPYQYVLTIPKEYIKGGRNFKLLAIGEGRLYIYDDLDAAGDTITFSTDYPSTAYAIVYKDA